MKYERDGSWNISFNRLLAKHELINDSYKTYAGQKYANYGTNKNIRSEAEKKSTHSQIRGDGINNFYAYMKDYKNRYAKKKGLAKWDCYYEKKVLNKINNMYEITDNIRNNNKLYNKIIYNKYLIRLILFCLLPCIGLLMPLFFNKYNPLLKKFCFSDCDESTHQAAGGKTIDQVHDEKGLFFASISYEHFKIIETLNTVFVSLLLIIVSIVVFYILLKYIKYARLRAGKGKMSLKEYCTFSKDLITAK
ncbi:hypothetical protein PVMG_06113 [Plasmodium vivax Mauritania I]|uniref:Variable surface protein n=1 Tax=Plasmodium vivax Mauritania I TaxID=1035515 RepID=A0A0J9TJL0_PLAVI|nr:hypothetical protein PVMG_06113 [Plasmodium vivax Mauritania I]